MDELSELCPDVVDKDLVVRAGEEMLVATLPEHEDSIGDDGEVEGTPVGRIKGL